MSEQLRQERRSLRLVCCCEDCEHFVGDAAAPTTTTTLAPGGCDLLYPTAPHRQATWEAAQDGDEVSFCKMFEAR
jgi:hypothetical protein